MLMKRSHTKIWRELQAATASLRSAGQWDSCRHEDTATVGVPDVSFSMDCPFQPVSGWIEIKSLARWPLVGRTKIRDLTIHQVKWMERRSRTGCPCWILISVGQDYVLVPVTGDNARELYRMGMPKKHELPEGWVLWERRIQLLNLTVELERSWRTP
jgi:hypothetical protein